ncbi:MAG: FAD-dependent oxidoreductase, partial [Proteobacteria bacterium]|nr:FAD-dependent oxidoreductase [Pseudomonadota bacterium]
MSATIAVIGAGLAGLTLAHRLAGHAEVRVFEKGDRAGGRLSTIRSGGFQFDHGAQYFTIRSGAFRIFLEPALAQGVIAPWDPVIVTLEAGKKEVTESRDEAIYVARPGMNGLCAHLAEGLAVATGADIVCVEKDGGGWRLVGALGRDYGVFDWVVSTAPAPQGLALLPDVFAHRRALHRARMRACFALMLGFDAAFPVTGPITWQGAFAKGSPIGWMAVDSHKPGREGGVSLLVQSAGDW